MKQIERGRQKGLQVLVFVDVLMELQVVSLSRVFFNLAVNIAAEKEKRNRFSISDIPDLIGLGANFYLRMAMSRLRSRMLRPIENRMLKVMATLEPTWSGHVSWPTGSLMYWSVESLVSVTLQSPTVVKKRADYSYQALKCIENQINSQVSILSNEGSFPTMV